MRGIGCGFMIIVPIFSYALGSFLAEKNLGLGVLPPEWYSLTRPIPPIAYKLSGPVLTFFSWLSNIPHLPATLAMGLIILIILGGLLSIIYGYMYSIFAPSKYGPLDVPAPRIKTKKYKR